MAVARGAMLPPLALLLAVLAQLPVVLADDEAGVTILHRKHRRHHSEKAVVHRRHHHQEVSRVMLLQGHHKAAPPTPAGPAVRPAAAKAPARSEPQALATAAPLEALQRSDGLGHADRLDHHEAAKSSQASAGAEAEEDGFADEDMEENDVSDWDREERRDAHQRHQHIKQVQEDLRQNLNNQAQVEKLLDYARTPSGFQQHLTKKTTEVTKETTSKGLAGMLGAMWRELRLFATPTYRQRLHQQEDHLKKQERGLREKYPSVLLQQPA